MSRIWKQKTIIRRASLWMLAFLIVIELLLHGIDLWELDRASPASDFDRVLDAVVSRSQSPKIVVFGSSRFQYAVNPKTLEDELELDGGEVANLAYLSGTAQDYLNIYLAEREFFSSAKTLVVEVGAYSYNWNLIDDEMQGNARFRRMADLSDRSNVPGIDRKIDYLAGYFLRTWDSRHVLEPTIWSMAGGDFDQWGSRHSVSVDSAGQINTRFPPKLEQGADLPHEWDFRKFKFSEYQLGKLVELVRIAKADGASVLLMESPLNESFVQEVAAHYAVEDRYWREQVQDATGLQIVSLGHSDTGCSEWYRCYYDYGHMTPIGANSFSISLANLLSNESLIANQSITSQKKTNADGLNVSVYRHTLNVFSRSTPVRSDR
jgi:hypothetical protein